MTAGLTQHNQKHKSIKAAGIIHNDGWYMEKEKGKKTLFVVLSLP